MKNVEDIYALTPMQEIMLFHASTQGEKDVLVNQVCFLVDGRIDPAALHDAWQYVVERHSVLRSTFLWQGLKRPQQVIRSEARLPFLYVDISDKSKPEQEAYFQQFCHDDGKRGLSLDCCPLMRVALLQTSATRAYMIWSSHHLILDRWCTPILLNDVIAHYDNAIDKAETTLRKGPPFKQYVTWIQQQDREAALHYWITQLQGFRVASAISQPSAKKHVASSQPQLHKAAFQGEQFVQLTQFCHNQKLTLATVVQGAWALVLNQVCEACDVVFGVVVSGRPANLLQVESMLGSFVNNLPVRVKISDQSRLGDWLQLLQSALMKRSPYEYVALDQIQTWSELPPESALFDCILVWLAAQDRLASRSVSLTNLNADMGTAYPVTLNIDEQQQSLNFTLQIKSGHQLLVDGDRILELLHSTLGAIANASADAPLSAISSVRGKLVDSHPITTRKIDYSDAWQPQALDDALQQNLQRGREGIATDVIEQYLLLQWRRILSRDDINVDDDFFSLGGDSIKAARLLVNIQQSTRKAIPMLALFKGRTIIQMAEIIANQEWPAKADIALPLQTSGQLPALFCIASPEVNTVGYANLAHYLHKDIPVYALQAPPVSAQVNSPTFAEIRALVPAYVKAIRTIQATGPYTLLGMCSGAYLAVEIARELEQQNEKINYLGVVNTWSFYTVSRTFYLARIWSRIRYYQRRISALFGSQRYANMGNLRDFIRNKVAAKKAFAQSQEGNKTRPQQPRLAMSDLGQIGWAHKQPPITPLNATMHIYRLARQPFHKVRKACLGWSDYVSAVKVEAIDGTDHLAILREPFVQDLAEKINKSLRTPASASVRIKSQQGSEVYE